MPRTLHDRLGRGFGLFAAVAAVMAGVAPAALGQCRLGWKFGDQQGLPGLSVSLGLGVVFDDGSGDALYVGGWEHVIAGNVLYTGVARWDGRAWSAVGDLSRAFVRAFIVHQGQLIAGGFFTLSNGEQARVIRWDGGAWVSMSEGLISTVGAFGTFHGRLLLSYTGANFGPSPNPRPDHFIYEWDGNRWIEMGSEIAVRAHSFVEYRGELFAHMYLGKEPRSFLSKWNGEAWEPFGEVYRAETLALYQDKLLVGGVQTVGGKRVKQVVAWDGTEWTNFGDSIPGSVYDMLVHDGRVYATGHDVSRPYREDPMFVATWNGSEWVQIGQGQLSGYTNGIMSFGGELIVSGVRGIESGAQGLARFDGLDWQPLGNGFDDQILRFGVHGDELFAYGEFGRAGTAGGVEGLARWNGQEWRGVGAGGPNNEILEFVTYRDDLIAVGEFTEIGGVPANYIARWDGVVWSAIGEGANAPILGAAVHDGELVVVGEFTSIGGVSAEKVASWDGQRWRQIGSGFDNNVTAVYASEGALYVGGDFRFTRSGTWLFNTARWDGQQWQMMYPGLGRAPVSMVSFRGELMVVSRNARSGRGMSVSGWNGNNWFIVGDVLSGHIFDIAEYNDELYITGDFRHVTSELIPAQQIARWNGREWRPVGEGLAPRRASGNPARSRALAVYNGELIVGGEFHDIEGNVSAHWARWGCVSCYADCDNSTGAGVLDLVDYLCFQSSFVAGDPYACDCDTGTGPGVCDMLDFICFQKAFMSGCP